MSVSGHSWMPRLSLCRWRKLYAFTGQTVPPTSVTRLGSASLRWQWRNPGKPLPTSGQLREIR